MSSKVAYRLWHAFEITTNVVSVLKGVIFNLHYRFNTEYSTVDIRIRALAGLGLLVVPVVR